MVTGIPHDWVSYHQAIDILEVSDDVVLCTWEKLPSIAQGKGNCRARPAAEVAVYIEVGICVCVWKTVTAGPDLGYACAR